MDAMRQHLFDWADEGFIDPYYFSEKLWDAFQATAALIYVDPNPTLNMM